MAVHGISNQVPKLLGVNQKRVDGVKGPLRISLGYVLNGVDDDSTKLRQDARIKVLLSEAVVELKKTPPGLREAIHKGRMDLLGTCRTTYLLDKRLDKVGNLNLNRL
jgi:hypothetical protein